MKKRAKRRIAASAAIAMFLIPLNFHQKNITVLAQDICSGIDDCNEVASNAKDKIEALQATEEKLAEELAALNEEITTLKDKISEKEANIAKTESEIADLETEIAHNQVYLDETKKEIDELSELVASRIAVTHRFENTSSLLSILTESASLADFISELRTINRWVKSDADNMDQLKELLEKYDTIFNELNDQANTLKEQKATLTAEMKELESDQLELVVLEGNLRSELSHTEEMRLSEEEALKAAESIKNALSGSSTGNPGNVPVSTGLISPLPGAVVTGEFEASGWRPGGFHTGIDLALPGNPAVIAPADGKVVLNEWHNTNGNYLILAHNINGQKIFTLYAHLQSRSPLAVGATVKQGDYIGNQGNTGFSLGAHLHFEVHVNDFVFSPWGANAVNPRNWVNF